ncbi:hypothetical protein PVOR_27225 [Paenibacillus vortex V453]|uniref:Uncharacterized protein n=1 Tax=Paenibacillus vortex V453 TaxID=715225 RepID=A0A2R9SNU2_9BACL|nr:hypothetical protein PVOR_27225 [Paenibacillus vortex V453]
MGGRLFLFIFDDVLAAAVLELLHKLYKRLSALVRKGIIHRSAQTADAAMAF